MNNGAVYAVFDFKADNSDELDMHIGDLFTVLKKGDEQEKEWWWVKMGTQEGYIPRNLLGVSLVYFILALIHFCRPLQRISLPELKEASIFKLEVIFYTSIFFK